MRPRLKSVLRRVARDDHTLQFGVHPGRAVVLTNVAPAVRHLLDRLDGTHTLDQVLRNCDLDEDTALRVITMLIERGLVEDAAVSPEPLSDLSTAERDRLRPELDRLALTAVDGGVSGLATRRTRLVRLYGAGRIGAQVATLLAAAGIGHICVVDPEPAQPQDVVPGGLGWTEVGLPREEGVVAVLRRIAPAVNAWPGRLASQPDDRGSRPDLVVLAPVGPLDPVLAHTLTGEGIPHLLVAAVEGHGMVGPFVVPGVTPCLRCLDLTRRDRDPSWPMLSARLGGYPVSEIACDTPLSALVAARATGHALDYLDGTAMIYGMFEVTPDWHWHRRTWDVHPQCGCGRNGMTSIEGGVLQGEVSQRAS